MEKNMYEGIPSEYSTPPLNYYRPEERSLSLVKELSPQDHLKEQMAWLEGKIWDDIKKRYIPLEGMKPFMNQEGRDMFFQFATSILSPIVTMSNYTNNYKMIHGLVRMSVKKATIHFHLHWRDYGIKRKTQITLLTDKLTILGLSAFYKAIGGGDRKAATSNISENISTLSRNYQEQGEPQRKQGGMFGFLRKR